MIEVKQFPASRINGIKSSLEFVKSPLNALRSNTELYGANFQTSIGFKKVYFSSSPEVIKHILQTNNKNYVKDFSYKQLRLILGNGLITNEGESWMQQRRLAQPAFHKQRMDGLFKIMSEVVARFVDDFEQHRGQTIDIVKPMMNVTLEIVAKALFSHDLNTELDHIHDSISFLQQYVIDRLRRPYLIPFMAFNGKTRRYRREMKTLSGLMQEIIDKRREKNSPVFNDLLAMFMEAKDLDTGEFMSNQQLIDEANTMMGAGHETSANALSWTWMLIAKHPEVHAKIVEEANRVLGDDLVTFEKVMQLQYCKQVVEEGMRLYPPAWVVGRQNLEEDQLMEYRLPKDSTIMLQICTVHRNPEFWPDPERFDPDRFSKEKSKKRPKFHYLPFGAGPRMCIGNLFAVTEMQLILAQMSRRFKFEIAGNQEIVPYPLITMRAKHGIKLNIS